MTNQNDRNDMREPAACPDDGVERAVWTDALTILPLGLLVGFPVALILVWAGPFDWAFFGAPLVLLAWAAAAIWAFQMVLLFASARLWRRALSTAVLPLVTLPVIFSHGDFVWTGTMYLGESLHFQVMRGTYVAEIAKLPADRGPRLKFFPWGGFVVGHGVVYDESDELTLPSDERSAAWNRKAYGTELECGVWGAPAGDHFYIVRTGC